MVIEHSASECSHASSLQLPGKMSVRKGQMTGGAAGLRFPISDYEAVPGASSLDLRNEAKCHLRLHFLRLSVAL
jgi:hypothetical protein